MGGWSSEQEVSRTSGRGVAAALRERGLSNVTELEMEHDVASRLAELKPDVVFNALHGTPGEDGTVQGMMDLMGLKYTHSGLTTSAIAIDKELTKLVLVPHGIRMPAGKVVESESLFREDPMARPYVVKPVNEGSSVGVAIVTAEGNYGNPIGRDVEGPWHQFDHLLAEPFIKGRELTVAVLGDEPLAVTELKIDSGFYDYEHKYTDGRTVHVCPAEVPDDIARSMMEQLRLPHTVFWVSVALGASLKNRLHVAPTRSSRAPVVVPIRRCPVRPWRLVHESVLWRQVKKRGGVNCRVWRQAAAKARREKKRQRGRKKCRAAGTHANL